MKATEIMFDWLRKKPYAERLFDSYAQSMGRMLLKIRDAEQAGLIDGRMKAALDYVATVPLGPAMSLLLLRGPLRDLKRSEPADEQGALDVLYTSGWHVLRGHMSRPDSDIAAAIGHSFNDVVNTAESVLGWVSGSIATNMELRDQLYEQIGGDAFLAAYQQAATLLRPSYRGEPLEAAIRDFMEMGRVTIDSLNALRAALGLAVVELPTEVDTNPDITSDS